MNLQVTLLVVVILGISWNVTAEPQFYGFQAQPQWSYLGLQQQLQPITANHRNTNFPSVNIIQLCPNRATGASLVINQCYSAETTPETFQDAITKCENKGGILAEPVVGNSASRSVWYKLLNYKLSALKTLSSNPWIGLRREKVEDSSFQFLVGKGLVPSSDAELFDDTVEDDITNLQAVAVINPSGATWERVSNASTSESTVKRPFICQYEPILSLFPRFF